jgi:GNAT superfamily N-acetyltransferase
MNGIVLQSEPIDEVWDEAHPLTQRHFAEANTFLDVPLQPNRKIYEAAQKAGLVRCYTARITEGDRLTLIGYGVAILGSLHHENAVFANQDTLYIAPEYRKTGAGLALLRHIERALAAEGVQWLYQHQRVTHPGLGVILRARHYIEVEKVWAKRLTGIGAPAGDTTG